MEFPSTSSTTRAASKCAIPSCGWRKKLWDNEQMRLTVLFDPGRIKRGLVSQEELGMATQAGRKYRLVIDQDWPDANSVPGILEDLAGNKVYTPFDVDAQAMPNAPGPSNICAVPFRVGAAQ
jgi:hypothetical protein